MKKNCSSNSEPSTRTLLERFKKSMEITYDKWHDGIGYDLTALKEASQTDRARIEQILINHQPRDWRDIEALAQISTITARQAIKEAIHDANPAVRVAVGRFAPELVTDSERKKSIIAALETAEVFGGLSQILDEIEKFHPKEIEDALIVGLLNRKGDVAVLFAAMLFYLHGLSKESFDWEQRPFFLLFNTENREKRVEVFKELCNKLNINPEEYLNE
jgi:hypothetical protein